MRPRHRGSAPPTQKHPPVTETPAEQHLFTAMPGGTAWFCPRGPGNLLRDCELSGNRLCLDLFLGCKDAAGRLALRLSLEGNALVQVPPPNPASLPLRSSPPPPCSQELSLVTPLVISSSHTLAYICLCTGFRDLALQPYCSLPSSPRPLDLLSAPQTCQTCQAQPRPRTFALAVPVAWNVLLWLFPWLEPEPHCDCCGPRYFCFCGLLLP